MYTTQQLKVYQSFKALDESDPHGRVRFYEQYRKAIHKLDLDEYFDCTYIYAKDLLETEKCTLHLEVNEGLLALCMEENIGLWNGEEVYEQLLLMRAKALIQLDRLDEGVHVLKQLLRIYPDNKLAARIMRICLIQQKPKWLSYSRAATIVLLFLAVLVIAAEIMFIKSFWPLAYNGALIAHNVLLGSAILVLGIGEGLHAGRCYLSTHTHIVKARTDRAAKSST